MLLDDADDKTRKNARKAYTKYQELYPQYSTKLWTSLPGYVKKTIEGEKEDVIDSSNYSKSVVNSHNFNKSGKKLQKRKYSQESDPQSVTHTERSNVKSVTNSIKRLKNHPDAFIKSLKVDKRSSVAPISDTSSRYVESNIQ